MDMILKTTDLCKNFKGQMAVNNVSLNIQRNSVYGLLGPNGAGKSTTLKMITGILRPTSGSIEFDGHPWQRSDLTQIGALIETPPLYENLTAYENLKVRTTMLGLTDNRIDEVLHIVRLTDTGKKRAGQFSLGMKQRLGIAIALLNNPQLLILDEPTNGLDPVGIEELRELIRSFPSKGIIKIDLSAKTVQVDGETVSLTKSEYMICEFLARNKGQVFTREQIYEAVFSLDGESDNSTIATHIKNIRAKLNHYDIQPITTVWGVGYKWE